MDLDQFIRRQNVERYSRILFASPRNRTDRKYPIYLPQSNKSKKTLVIRTRTVGYAS